MTDLHPHWHSTGDDEGVIRPSAPEPEPVSESGGVHINIQPASRLPAAIAGIAIFTVLGITLAGGWRAVSDTFTAQVGGSGSSTSSSAGALTPVEIHISGSSGFQPESVTVRPGQQIIWINDQSIPHILTSQTLRDGSGAYVNTPAIFPGARITFTVGPRETNRQHIVTSTTDQTLVGTVIVSASGPGKASSSSRKAPFGTTDGVNLPSGQGTAKTGGSGTPGRTAKSSPAAGKKSSSGAQPTVSGGNSSPPAVPPSPQVPAAMDPAANPYAGGTPTTIDVFTPQDVAYTPAPDDVIAPETPAAKAQPDTGPGLWAVCLMSLAVLWGATRRYFRRISVH